MIKNRRDFQIQELETKHTRENKEKDKKISDLENKIEKQDKTISSQNNRMKKLENNFKKFLEQQIQSTNNQENTEDIKNSKKLEYQD